MWLGIPYENIRMLNTITEVHTMHWQHVKKAIMRWWGLDILAEDMQPEGVCTPLT